MRSPIPGLLLLTVWLIGCGDAPTEPVVHSVPRSVAFATSSTDDGLSITTDKDDYQPGDTVHLTGGGWQPFDVLDILLVDEPQSHEPHTWAVNAGMDGTFHDSTYVVDTEDLGVTFTLTATSRLTGRSLSVVFTDAAINLLMLSVIPTPFSPNQASSQGTKDQTTITLRNPPGDATGISVRIRAGTALAGAVVRSFPTFNIPGNSDRQFIWDGKDNAFNFVPDGIYTARITSGGLDFDTDAKKRVIVVDNTNPSVTIDPVSGAIGNQPITVTGTAADLPAAPGVGVERVFVTILDASDEGTLFSDLATNTGTNFSTWSFSFMPTEATSYIARARATDNAGNRSTRVDVHFGEGDGGGNDDDNQAPTADAGGPYIVNEGTAKLLDGAASSDPDGDGVTHLWSVDFVGIDPGGECEFFDPEDPTDPGAPASDLEQPEIECTDDGVFELTLVVTDQHGLSSAESEAELTVRNVTPSVALSPASRTIPEGGTAAFAATVTDPGANDQLTFAWSTTVAPCGLSGLPPATLDGASFSCADNGTGKVRLQVDDQDQNGTASAEADLTVQNVAPTASFNAPAAVDEGSPFMLSLTSPHDASSVDVAAGLQYTFDCGDGAGYGPLGSASTRSCPTTDDATRMVKGKIQDKDGGFTEYTGAVEVENVAPTILSWTASPATVVIGATLDFTAAFSDPGADTHTAEVDCGSGYGAAAAATSPFGYSCAFGSIGPKTIRIRIQDDDGGSDEEIHTLTVVYNFSGFFPPVDRPNTMNSSKAGQTIPLKWRLTNASGQGVTGVTGVTVQSYGISCPLGTNNDVMEEEAAGSSGLQDKGDGYYQFNWKTPESYAGTCKSIALVFGSGGVGYTEKPGAFFTFKK